jgi:hypothetical protein
VPLLSFVTIARRSSTHFAYCRSLHWPALAGAIVTSHAPSAAGLSLIMKWNFVPDATCSARQ